MKLLYFTFVLSLFIFTPVALISAQVTPSNETKTLSNKKFSFNYPADWKFTDKSSKDIWQFNLSPPKGNVLILVISYDMEISSFNEFRLAKSQTYQIYFDKIYKKLNASDRANIEEVCTTIDGIVIPGRKMSGIYDHAPTTAEFYYFVINKRFFNIIYLREDKEAEKATTGWETIYKTLAIKDKNPNKPDFIIDLDNGQVLNSKAVKLPAPIFPTAGSKLYGNNYRIEVKVTLDENGKVISARAVSGREEFYGAAEQAAKAAKFLPGFICGKPSTIVGIIEYNFILR